jgi:hypothetical protein
VEITTKKAHLAAEAATKATRLLVLLHKKENQIMEIKPGEGLLKDSQKKRISLPTETRAKKESSIVQSHQ